MLTRALLAFVALPGLVAFVVPLLIAWPQIRDGAFDTIAVIPLVLGIALLLWCVRDFLVKGKGTLAPWDPPRQLVSSGPYRFSRNPMYIAVSLIVLGWSIAFRSWTLLAYAVLLMIAFHLRVVFGEEPWLERAHARQWSAYAAKVPRWIFPTRRAVLAAWVALFVAIPVAGMAYEAYADARAAREFPPPGVMVDIGGRRLHLICIGSGEPTVLFEPSGWSNASSLAAVRERLASRVTVCSYDRRGQGWSDAAPGVTTVGALASDLGVLQDRAKLAWPLVLVGSSIGGLTVEMFARLYPERVAGLVFVDAANSLMLASLESRSGSITASACTAGLLAQFGVVRLANPFGIEGDSDGARRGAALAYSGRTWAEICAMARGFEATRQEFAQAPPLRANLPLVALSASSAVDLVPPFATRYADPEEARSQLEESHRALAQKTTRGTWKKVPESTHLIGSSQPDAVADAVFDVLDVIAGRSTEALKLP